MQFSTQHISLVHNFLNQAEEPVIKAMLASFDAKKLRGLLSLVQKSIRNKNFDYTCRCMNCQMHILNVENDVDVCASFLSE